MNKLKNKAKEYCRHNIKVHEKRGLSMILRDDDLYKLMADFALSLPSEALKERELLTALFKFIHTVESIGEIEYDIDCFMESDFYEQYKQSLTEPQEEFCNRCGKRLRTMGNGIIEDNGLCVCKPQELSDGEIELKSLEEVLTDDSIEAFQRLKFWQDGAKWARDTLNGGDKGDVWAKQFTCGFDKCNNIATCRGMSASIHLGQPLCNEHKYY